MKSVLILLFLVGWYIPFFAQPCNSVHVSLINQSDVEGFLAQNGNCTEIVGDLVIGSGIEHLDGLENIQKIGGYLSMSNADRLVDISGLSGLQEVGSWVRIQNNPVLSSFEGLDNLKKIRGDFFYIAGNARVKNLEGLSGLDSISGIFQIWNMDSLTNLNNLNNLKYIGGDCSIFKNENLLHTEGLDSLRFIRGAFSIYENPNLQSVIPLSPMLQIQGQLAIYKNPQLELCHAEAVCQKLATMPDAVYIADNKSHCINKETVLVNCTSSTDEGDENLFTFYPNPAAEFISNVPDEAVIIFAMYGQHSWTLRPENNVLDISFLPAGPYIVKIQNRYAKLLKL